MRKQSNENFTVTSWNGVYMYFESIVDLIGWGVYWLNDEVYDAP